MRNGYDDDWFRINLTKTGYVKLNFTNSANITSDANYYYVVFSDVDRNYLASTYVRGSQKNVTLPTVGLPAGAYYIHIKGCSSTYWSAAPYSVKATFTASSSWETEFNDYYGDADPLSVNSTYSGTMRDAYDDDWYRIKLTRPGYVKLKFANGANTTSDTNYYYISFMDVNRNYLTSTYVKGSQKSISLPAVGLPAGAYYIKVTAPLKLILERRPLQA